MSNKQILFESFPKQDEFFEAVFSNKYDFVLYGGAIRGGKTFAGLGAIFLLCKVYPGSRWAVVRKDLPTLKRNTIPSFNKIKPDKFIKSYNQETQVVTCENGSQIIFFSENYDTDKDLNRWKGLEVNGFLLEEINELNEKSFYKALERAGSYIIPKSITNPNPKQPPKKIMGTCNPAKNWVRDMFYYPYTKGELNERWLYIPSRIFDNPHIPKDYIDSLRDLPKYEYEVYVLGNWDIELRTGGEFYKCFSADKHVKQCKYNPNIPLHISFDENVKPYITATVYQIAGKSIKQIHEFCLETPNNTVEILCQTIEREYFEHASGVFVYGDATSRKSDTKLEKGQNFFTLILHYLRKYKPQLRVPMSNPSVVMRGRFINHIFDKEFTGITFELDESCKNSIRDFNNLQEDADGTKKKEKESINGVTFEKYGHTSDTFDYLVCMAFANDYLTYQKGTDAIIATVGKNKQSKHGY